MSQAYVPNYRLSVNQPLTYDVSTVSNTHERIQYNTYRNALIQTHTHTLYARLRTVQVKISHSIDGGVYQHVWQQCLCTRTYIKIK